MIIRITSSPEIISNNKHIKLQNQMQDSLDLLNEHIREFDSLFENAEEKSQELDQEDNNVVELWEILKQCTGCVYKLEKLKTQGHQDLQKLNDIIEEMQTRIRNLKNLNGMEMMETLALRQLCSTTQDKFIRQIAGKYPEIFYGTMRVAGFEDLEEARLRHLAPPDLYSYFAHRIQKLESYLGMTESMSILSDMYRVCTKEETITAHYPFPYSAKDLIEMAKIKMPYQENDYRRFIDYAKSLSSLRHEELLVFDKKRCVDIPITNTRAQSA